jgi:hypothetical protein
MEHRWEIAVSSGSYYPSLCSYMRGNDISLCYDDEQGMVFYAFSHHADELHDPRMAASRFFSLGLLLNGAIRVAWRRVPEVPTSFEELYSYSPRVKQYVSADVIDEYPFSNSDLPTNSFSTLDAIKSHWPSYLLHLAKTDEFLRHLLFCVGMISDKTQIERIHTWATLYKVLDSIKTGCRELGIKLDSLCKLSEVDRFTAACNNESVLGLYARHGLQQNTPPKRVMTSLDEATQFIVSLAGDFVDKHIETKFP